MRSKFFLLILLLMPGLVDANGLLFSHLKRLHTHNSSRCLEVSKRYIKSFPNQPAPYYFAAISYSDKAEVSRETRGRYLNLNQCIGYALKFDATDNEKIVNEVGWIDFKKYIKVRALDVIKDLQLEKQFKMAKRLTNRLVDLYGNIELPIIEPKADPPIFVNEKEAIYVNTGSNIKFYDLPTGREVVTSFDLVGEQELLRLINKERVKKGQKPLVWDKDLARAARYHSYDEATQNYFNHSSYDRNNGKLVKVGNTFERIRKFYLKSFVNSENIAAGNKGAESTYQQWYTSKGHYDNMFNPESGKVGIGVYYEPKSAYGYYWTFCTAK